MFFFLLYVELYAEDTIFRGQELSSESTYPDYREVSVIQENFCGNII